MSESFMDKMFRPQKGIADITEKAVEKAINENKTPILNSLSEATRATIKKEFPITTDDHFAEDVARHLLFEEGKSDARNEGEDTGTILTQPLPEKNDPTAILKQQQQEVVERRRMLKKTLAQLDLDMRTREKRDKILNDLHNQVSIATARLKIFEEMLPSEHEKIEHARTSIGALESEIDQIERRTVPGSEERLYELYKKVLDEYNELGQIIAPTNPRLN